MFIDQDRLDTTRALLEMEWHRHQCGCDLTDICLSFGEDWHATAPATWPIEDVIRVYTSVVTEHGRPEKLRIYLNRYLKGQASTNKLAAHAVHAALEAFGVHPGVRVVVLDAGPTKMEAMTTVIHDAGYTELTPGTLTASTDWPYDSEP